MCLVIWGFTVASRKHRGKTGILTFIALDGTAMVMVVGTCLSFVYVALIHVVFYHVIFWALLPVPKILRAQKSTAVGYFAMVGIPVLILCAMTLSYPMPYKYVGVYEHPVQLQVLLWGYLHIFSSFFLSTLNPSWLRRLTQACGIPAGISPKKSLVA